MYFQEGVEVANKQLTNLSAFLMSDNLPIPKTLEVHFSDATIPPFSDKLMLYHTGLSNAYGIENYGIAISKIMRHNIATKFATLTAAIGKYADDGLKLMIEHGWLEQPPTCANRKNLSNVPTTKKQE